MLLVRRVDRRTQSFRRRRDCFSYNVRNVALGDQCRVLRAVFKLSHPSEQLYEPKLINKPLIGSKITLRDLSQNSGHRVSG